MKIPYNVTCNDQSICTIHHFTIGSYDDPWDLYIYLPIYRKNPTIHVGRNIYPLHGSYGINRFLLGYPNHFTKFPLKILTNYVLHMGYLMISGEITT